MTSSDESDTEMEDVLSPASPNTSRKIQYMAQNYKAIMSASSEETPRLSTKILRLYQKNKCGCSGNETLGTNIHPCTYDLVGHQLFSFKVAQNQTQSLLLLLL